MNPLFLLVLIGIVIAIIFRSPIFSVGNPKHSSICPVCSWFRGATGDLALLLFGYHAACSPESHSGSAAWDFAGAYRSS